MQSYDPFVTVKPGMASMLLKLKLVWVETDVNQRSRATARTQRIKATPNQIVTGIFIGSAPARCSSFSKGEEVLLAVQTVHAPLAAVCNGVDRTDASDAYNIVPPVRDSGICAIPQRRCASSKMVMWEFSINPTCRCTRERQDTLAPCILSERIEPLSIHASGVRQCTASSTST